MSNIVPIKIEYNLQIQNHAMKGVVEHLAECRRISFFFDEKEVAVKAVPTGDFLKDDDVIRDIVEVYCKNHNGVYADLFRYHSDKVSLVSKSLDFEIENYGIKMRAHVRVEKEKYIVEVIGNNEEDSFSSSFKSESFSEVLEKLRIFTGTLIEISDKFSANIDELSNDQVEEWIKWDAEGK